MKLNVFAPIGITGYGVLARKLILALDELGVDVTVFPAHEYTQPTHIFEERMKDLIAKRANTDCLDKMSLKISIGRSSEVMNYYGKKRIYETLLECDRIPDDWVKSLNTLDQVWNPSHWGKQTFIDSGVKEDILRVVPGAVDMKMFNPYKNPLIPRKDEDTFRFLNVGKWEMKKNQELLIRAYCEEFKPDEKVELFLSCTNYFVQDFNIYKELFNLRLSKHPPIIPIGWIPKYEDLARVYPSCDCFVAPARGEGWNLPLVEAMSSSLPCIATNWSSHTEYLTKDNALLLEDFDLVQAYEPMWNQYFKQGKWAEPKIGELKEKMRWVFDNREKAKEIGKKGFETMKKFNWENSAKIAIKCLEELE